MANETLVLLQMFVLSIGLEEKSAQASFRAFTAEQSWVGSPLGRRNALTSKRWGPRHWRENEIIR